MGLGTRLSLGTRWGWFYLMPSTRIVASYCNISCLLMQWLFVFSFATSHARRMTWHDHTSADMRNVKYWERVSLYHDLCLEPVGPGKHSATSSIPQLTRVAFGTARWRRPKTLVAVSWPEEAFVRKVTHHSLLAGKLRLCSYKQ